ncbi:hypothetical protein BDZ91DRAFT_293126 [Kalaharituber pfeilii]|nr:hypothetical protein BDZ91DRAFT_293126 [Kalaharituber pfeilii]
MSPRRSSRARPTSAVAHHSSSSSSASSTRASSTRLHRHQDDSVDHDSHFGRVRDDAALDTRHRNMSTTVDVHDPDGADDDVDETGSQNDEEVTRCICGFQEYQGEDEQADTSDGWFIQCDRCYVWQHGCCVGITDKALAPENYFCERCRPELHKLIIKPHGPKTSLYLPLHQEASPTESTQHYKDMPTKRRSTMNSRDAAYDEAVLQRVLEESKSDAKLSSSRNGTRGRKRGTSEGSDEQKEYKRARTSDSDTPTTGTVDSGDDKIDRGTGSSSTSKKGRNNTTRTTTVTTTATTTTTTTTSSKRTITRSKAAEKKDSKKDDSEHSDEFSVRANGRNNKITTASTPTEETSPPLVTEVVVPDTPQQSKRTSRTNNNHGRRKGNNKNNYRQSEDPHETVTSPAMTRDASQNGQEKNSIAQTKEEPPQVNGTIEKPSKPKIPQAKTSITDMNKRVNAIMEFIQRTQLEMANEKQRTYIVKASINSPRVNKTQPIKDTAMADAPSFNGVTSAVPQITINGNSEKQETSVVSALNGNVDFSNMHSTEIMDVLTRKLVHWQQTFGKMEKV